MADAPPAPRRVADHRGDAPGPLVIALGGIHGNEPAGLSAVARVVDRLRRDATPFSGRLVGLAGNLAALAEGRRFIAGDLNRRWACDRVAAIRRGALAARDAEDHEQAALLSELDALLAEPREGPVLLLDLHSFSSSGAPFCVARDHPADIALARTLGLPTLVGLDRFIGGTILELCRDEGIPVLGVEGGRHDDPRTARFHEIAIETALVEAGAVAAEDLPELAAGQAAIARAAAGLPAVVEVIHRHALDGAAPTGFAMRPGFWNLQPLYRGQPLADDADGVVVAPRSGWMLMPLYQGQGDDGFFVAVERPFAV